MILQRLVFGLLLVSGLSFDITALANEVTDTKDKKQTSVAVLDFYDLAQNQKWQWLGSGLADMLITDLSTVADFQVVDREALQDYLDELAFQESGLLDPKTLLQIGQIAGVEKVVFGHYQIDANQKTITIRASIVNIATQKSERVIQITGKLKQVLELEKELAKKLLNQFGSTLSKNEIRDLQFNWTQSLDATAHFYTAMDHYDRGETTLALAETRFAARIDADYLAARFWSGRLYLELAEYQHAELILKQILSDAQHSNYKQSYLIHTSLLLSQLYEKYLETPEKAIPVLETIKREKPDSFEQAEITYRLANFYKLTKQYNQSYELYVDLFKQLTQGKQKKLTRKYTIPYRSVHMMPSTDAMRKETLKKYQSGFLLAYHHSDTPPKPQSEMVLLSPDNPVYKKTGLFQNKVPDYYKDIPKPMFYSPKGMRFKAFGFEFKGKQKHINIYPEFYTNKEFDGTSLRGSMPAPVNGKSSARYETHQEMLQAFFFVTYTRDPSKEQFSWKIKAEFMPLDAPQPGSTEYWEKMMRNNMRYPVIVDTKNHVGGKTALLEDQKGAFIAVYDTKELGEQRGANKDSDFWLVYSKDKINFSGPKRLSAINSIANDYDPSLIQDRRNRFILTFVSDRRNKNELWQSFSQNGLKWKRPKRIKIRDDKGNAVKHLVSPKLFQDSKGFYRLAAYHTKKQQILFTQSKDLQSWEIPLFVDLSDDKATLHGWKKRVSVDYFEDNAGVYRLILSPDFHYKAELYLGSSNDSNDWEIQKKSHLGNSHPSVIQDNKGKYRLILSHAKDARYYENATYYPHQFSSDDWEHWQEAGRFPNMFLHVGSNLMKPSTLFQDKSGAYWLINHRNFDHSMQFFRTTNFPAKTIKDTFIAKPDAHRFANYHLQRQILKEKTKFDGNKELENCFQTARYYESCLKKASWKASPVSQKKTRWWWPW